MMQLRAGGRAYARVSLAYSYHHIPFFVTYSPYVAEVTRRGRRRRRRTYDLCSTRVLLISLAFA